MSCMNVIVVSFSIVNYKNLKVIFVVLFVWNMFIDLIIMIINGSKFRKNKF